MFIYTVGDIIGVTLFVCFIVLPLTMMAIGHCVDHIKRKLK